ncbi:hypothetical protein [uncultured Mediterranean phage uvMED]|nr:hypothetical protein [uncultured Mediterranean phage uvMED]
MSFIPNQSLITDRRSINADSSTIVIREAKAYFSTGDSDPINDLIELVDQDGVDVNNPVTIINGKFVKAKNDPVPIQIRPKLAEIVTVTQALIYDDDSKVYTQKIDLMPPVETTLFTTDLIQDIEVDVDDADKKAASVDAIQNALDNKVDSSRVTGEATTDVNKIYNAEYINNQLKLSGSYTKYKSFVEDQEFSKVINLVGIEEVIKIQLFCPGAGGGAAKIIKSADINAVAEDQRPYYKYFLPSCGEAGPRIDLEFDATNWDQVTINCTAPGEGATRFEDRGEGTVSSVTFKNSQVNHTLVSYQTSGGYSGIFGRIQDIRDNQFKRMRVMPTPGLASVYNPLPSGTAGAELINAIDVSVTPSQVDNGSLSTLDWYDVQSLREDVVFEVSSNGYNFKNLNSYGGAGGDVVKASSSGDTYIAGAQGGKTLIILRSKSDITL